MNKTPDVIAAAQDSPLCWARLQHCKLMARHQLLSCFLSISSS